jgi:hypothetical protein
MTGFPLSIITFTAFSKASESETGTTLTGSISEYEPAWVCAIVGK